MLPIITSFQVIWVSPIKRYGDWKSVSGSGLCTIWTDDRDGNGASLRYLTRANKPRMAYISNSSWNGRPPLFWSADGTSPVQVDFGRLDSSEYLAIRIDDKIIFGNTVEEATLALLTIAFLAESAWDGHAQFLAPNGGAIGTFNAKGFSEAQRDYEACTRSLQ